MTDLPRCQTNQVLVRSLADMARGMGKRTIAEFVEDEATLRLLREYGVDYAQGVPRRQAEAGRPQGRRARLTPGPARRGLQ